MEKVIEKLYEMYSKTGEFPLGKLDNSVAEEEWGLYIKLSLGLPEEYKKDFLRYVDLRAIRQNKEAKSIYEYSFKTAVKLIMEALKE